VQDNSFIKRKGRLNVRMGLQFNHRQEANDITKGDIYTQLFFLRTFNYDVQYVLPDINKWDVSIGVKWHATIFANKGIVFVLPEYDLSIWPIFHCKKKIWAINFNRWIFRVDLENCMVGHVC